MTARGRAHRKAEGRTHLGGHRNGCVPKDGEALLSPAATRALISRFLAAPEPTASSASHALLEDLTAREREVVALVAEGLTNQEIADRLYVSRLTVRTHVHRAIQKLDARDRAQLVVTAYRSGLVRQRT